MISELQATITKEGEAAQQEYEEFSAWCEDRAQNLGFEIKTGKAESESLKASINQEIATIESLQARAEELSGSIAKHHADMKAAIDIRAGEKKDFAAGEKELVETIGMLERASGILEKEMQAGSSMLQSAAGSLVEALSAMVQASLISNADVTRLTALVQSEQQAQDDADDEDTGAPAGDVYKSHSGNILETLQDLTEKAEAQLADARNKEVSNNNHFELLKQSLEDAIRVESGELDDARKTIGESQERRSAATGDLRVTTSDLAADESTKATLQQNCMTKASTYQAEAKSRGEELKTLAEAKKIIQEATGGEALVQASFLQTERSQLTSGTDLATLEVVRLIRDLARKQGSGALMQLASKMSSAMHSKDAFSKVKGLISDMISRLEQEAGADATKKAYCDKELAETNTKKAEKSDEIEKLSTKIDQMAAKSAQLKDEVAALESELAKLAKAQAQMDKLRGEEKTAFGESKAELEKGITGVQTALKVLKDYYASEGKAHDAADGSASGIIGLLEVVEADFSKNLAQITADEEAAIAEYEKVSKENEIEKTTK